MPEIQCRAVANTMKCAQSGMRMFWLCNPKNQEIFPHDLFDRVCIRFCCRGRECKRESDTPCSFLHPYSPEELKLETIKLIGNHFIAKKIVWFYEYHFLKVAGLKLKHKALLESKDRPTGKTA
jgi:hypothetical protein